MRTTFGGLKCILRFFPFPDVHARACWRMESFAPGVSFQFFPILNTYLQQLWRSELKQMLCCHGESSSYTHTYSIYMYIWWMNKVFSLGMCSLISLVLKMQLPVIYAVWSSLVSSAGIAEKCLVENLGAGAVGHVTEVPRKLHRRTWYRINLSPCDT